MNLSLKFDFLLFTSNAEINVHCSGSIDHAGIAANISYFGLGNCERRDSICATNLSIATFFQFGTIFKPEIRQ